jgi:hypothetical protein
MDESEFSEATAVMIPYRAASDFLLAVPNALIALMGRAPPNESLRAILQGLCLSGALSPYRFRTAAAEDFVRSASVSGTHSRTQPLPEW